MAFIPSKRLRFEIFKRDGFVCQYCGSRPPEVVLELDHINPRANGGDNSELNLITACGDCNRGKSDKVLTERIPRPDADLKFLEAQQEIAEMRRFLEMEQVRDELFGDLAARITKIWDEYFPYNAPPRDTTLTQWLRATDPDELVTCIQIAARRNARERIGNSLDIQQYIWGIMRTRQRESQQ